MLRFPEREMQYVMDWSRGAYTALGVGKLVQRKSRLQENQKHQRAEKSVRGVNAICLCIRPLWSMESNRSHFDVEKMTQCF